MRAPLAATLAVLSFACFLAARCALPGDPAGSGAAVVSILSYNVKSLFDERDDGTEFPDFSIAAGRWSESAYHRRLDAVAKAVLAALPESDSPPGPDVACLVEIENERVLADLSAGPLSRSRYAYKAIAPAAGGPFANGILSRLPILSLSSHALYLSGNDSSRPSGRAILEAELDAGGRPLVLYICHWKSRLEGARETEGERREAAALVRSLIAARLESDPGAEILVCGDFNEDPDEWTRIGGLYPTAFMPAGAAAPGAVWRSLPRLLVASRPAETRPREGEPVLYSPWSESGGYSYSYKGERNRLDGFLLAPGLLDGSGLSFKDFRSVDEPFLVDDSGAPIAWSSSKGQGYSDHLPILLSLDRFDASRPDS